MTTTKSHPALSDDVLWGARAIAAYINRDLQSTYHLIAKGLIPATKLGRQIIAARKSELDRLFSNDGPTSASKPIPREPKTQEPPKPRRRQRYGKVKLQPRQESTQ